MEDCTNNKNECTFAKDAYVRVKTRPTWQDVQNYFSNPSECTIRVIYLDSRNNGESVDIVKYKQFEDCTEFFYEVNNYYYVYIGLLRNKSANALAPILWNDVLRSLDTNLPIDDSIRQPETEKQDQEGSYVHVIKRSHYSQPRCDKKNPTVVEIVELFKSRLSRVYNKIDPTHNAVFIRLPYISPSKEVGAEALTKYHFRKVSQCHEFIRSPTRYRLFALGVFVIFIV